MATLDDLLAENQLLISEMRRRKLIGTPKAWTAETWDGRATRVLAQINAVLVQRLRQADAIEK